MRRFFLIFIILCFTLCIYQDAKADCAPVYDINASKKIAFINSKKDTSKIYYYKENSPKEKSIIGSSDKETNIIVVDKKSKKNKKEEKERNIEVSTRNDRIISQSSIKISAIYPDDLASVTNNYPGYRGTNQLVVYKREFGHTTNTNEFGKEAVVENGIVTKLTGANSIIPKRGYVISGHGSAKKWISNNLKIGTEVEIFDDTLNAYTTIDSYRYYAKHKIEQVEDILISTKSDYASREDKCIYNYLKKAKQLYKKSLRNASNNSIECAKESIKNATMAYRYTLPYLSGELKGVWIRPVQKTPYEVAQTLDAIKNTGIDNVFLETYYHGRTIFPSNVMRKYGFEVQNPQFSYDVLASWIKEAHKRGIKVHVWFQSFYVGNISPEINSNLILAKKPEWMNRSKKKADFEGYVSHPQEHNGYFLDPANPEVITFLLELIDEIATRYRVDGFNIDYVRYPNVSKENFNNQWGYTKYAREEFKQIYGVDPVEISKKDSLWDEWCQYRSDKITDYVIRVSKYLKYRKIMFSAVVFPDYKTSLQTKYQDWTNWTDKKYTDAITPLILTSDDELAYNMLEEIKKKAGEVTVYPGLFAGFIEADPEDLLRQIHIIRKLKLNGVILFDWAHLNSDYLEVLKTSVFKSQNF